MHKISLIEPSRWMDILNRWVDIQNKYEWIANLAPTFADVFVIVYPIFLIVKQWAIYIFFATLIAVLVNIWIQTFFYKERPNVVLNQVETGETLLHDILPTSSFPSDHAVVSMAVAIATLLWWLYNKKKFFIRSWIIFIIISLIMTACRILTLVHRPSDIFAWLLLWMLVPSILLVRTVRHALIRYIINPIIRFEKWVIKKTFRYEQ